LTSSRKRSDASGLLNDLPAVLVNRKLSDKSRHTWPHHRA
jgi:hypothetical protein